MTLHAVSLSVFAVLMAAAAFEDFRRLTIPNLLPILVCVAWSMFAATELTLFGMLSAIGCAVATFLAGAGLFAFGYLGGGDVKLLAAAVLWAGPHGTPALLLLTGLIGGLLAIFLLMPIGHQIVASARLLLGQSIAPPERGLAMPIPYGIGIAVAALLVVLSPYFG